MFTPYDFLNMRNNIDRLEYSTFMGYKPKKPRWFIKRPKDNLNVVYDNFETFYERGEVYLSSVLRANTALFHQISGDRPAQMLYTKDEYYYDHPEELLMIVDRLFNAKSEGTVSEEQYGELYSILYDDYSRPLNVKLPTDFTDGRDVWVTSIVMLKEHIPFHKISNFFYPLLVVEGESIGGMVVPKWAWSGNFRRFLNFNYNNRVVPHTYESIPPCYGDFFEPFCSKAFFQEHPIHYVLCTLLEVASFVTPASLYVRVCSTLPKGNVTNWHSVIGAVGVFLIGCGFTNVVWAFMDKYLGDKVTRLLFTVGILLTVASILLMK